MSWLGRFRTVRARILSHRTKSEPIANTPPGESFVVEGLGEDLGVQSQGDKSRRGRNLNGDGRTDPDSY